MIIDQECVNKCIESQAYMSSISQAYENEHSIEVILPFLQVIQPDIQILPIVMGSYSMESLCAISDRLVTICDPDETVIISSTDFSHFYEAAVAEKMDQKAISLLQTMDIEQLYKQNQQEKIQLCGIRVISKGCR
ncbi:AmmeMemoRadiSam system protein B [bacterium]|nr:AmmeMemoRadiSam system protein B [bacterium]